MIMIFAAKNGAIIVICMLLQSIYLMLVYACVSNFIFAHHLIDYRWYVLDTPKSLYSLAMYILFFQCLFVI